MVVTISVCEEVTRQDRIAFGNVYSSICQRSAVSGTLTQGTEVVSKCCKADLHQKQQQAISLTDLPHSQLLKLV